MGYRTIKRALGETNLERKCRVLFGLCLALLIAFTFWRVDVIGENLVRKNIHQMGRDWANISMYRLHWHKIEREEVFREFLDDFEKDLLTEDHRWEILRLGEDDGGWLHMNKEGAETQVPRDPEELNLLKELQVDWREQLRQRALGSAASGSTGSTEDAVAPAHATAERKSDFVPVFRERPDPEHKEYHYYQPVYWSASCLKCHSNMNLALSASDLASSAPSLPPYRVVKVSMSHEATSSAITKTRAWLSGIGILTVFLAMVALYVIVKYVIVKPLQHLRDVSEEISKGNTALRADIHTNDEFEELAHAFNRMLRHLIEAQSELRNLNENLDAKVDELAQLNMRLYDMNRLKSDFLANMSHELRTPLNSIIGFSEVLAGVDSLTEKQKRYAQNIQKSGRVLLEMINDILDLAKLEAGKMEVRPGEFQVGVVVAAQCDMVRSLTEEKNIDLSVITDESAPPVYQDQSKVQQILTNLLSNAIKFTPEGGRITVTAKRTPDDKLLLQVADTGVGIPEEDREVIFEKFRQSTAVLANGGLTREHSGTGLGLSIIRELCKLLGGEVSVESELGRGSTFHVVLPWTLPGRPQFGSSLSERLSEIVKPDSSEFRRHPATAARPVA